MSGSSEARRVLPPLQAPVVCLVEAPGAGNGSFPKLERSRAREKRPGVWPLVLPKALAAFPGTEWKEPTDPFQALLQRDGRPGGMARRGALQQGGRGDRWGLPIRPGPAQDSQLLGGGAPKSVHLCTQERAGARDRLPRAFQLRLLCSFLSLESQCGAPVTSQECPLPGLRSAV